MQLRAIHGKFLTELREIYDSHEASVISDIVFEEIAKTSKSHLITEPAMVLPTDKIDALEEALDKLKLHQPVQYIVGKAWFNKLPYYVTPAVLIPRPETEELVTAVLQFIQPERKETVLDVGTGSGCIAISIKKNNPATSVTAIDVSHPALEVAKQNAAAHATMIDFRQLDFLDENSWTDLRAYDIIVSNPPYIPFSEKQRLDKNVTEHEPAIALFVPEDDPLLFYKKIAAFGSLHLALGGKIFMEAHEDYAQQVLAVFARSNYEALVLKDFYGKERMVMATHSL